MFCYRDRAVHRELEPYYLARMAQTTTYSRCQTWSPLELATIDFMVAKAVPANVFGVRRFFAANPHLRPTNRRHTDKFVALKIRLQAQK